MYITILPVSLLSRWISFLNKQTYNGTDNNNNKNREFLWLFPINCDKVDAITRF